MHKKAPGTGVCSGALFMNCLDVEIGRSVSAGEHGWRNTMDLNIKSRNGKVSERQRQHIQEKLGRLGRYMDQLSNLTIEISTEQRRGEGEVHRVQVTLVGEHGILLRAEERSTDLFAAVDSVQSILQRQIVRYKDKHWRRGKLRRQAGKFVEAEPVLVAETAVATQDEVEEPAPQIVRTKEFHLKPMFSDEAVEQMELLGHDFFIFRDADTLRVSVIYRRKDGNYGLIDPEEN